METFFKVTSLKSSLLLRILKTPSKQPQLSETTTTKLETYNFNEKIFKRLWKLKVRPRAKNFFYLWLRNSTPIAHGEPCPLCAIPQHQNHLWGECPTTLKIVKNLKHDHDQNLTGFVIALFSVWLTFCHFQHNSTPKDLFNDFFEIKIGNEKKRQNYHED